MFDFDFFDSLFPKFPDREPDQINEFLSPDGKFKIIEEIWFSKDGESYQKATRRIPLTGEKEQVQKDLDKAVQEENYELAALLRDKLADLDNAKNAEAEITKLELQLKKAVDEQNYELAAELSNKIKKLRDGGETQSP